MFTMEPGLFLRAHCIITIANVKNNDCELNAKLKNYFGLQQKQFTHVTTVYETKANKPLLICIA